MMGHGAFAARVLIAEGPACRFSAENDQTTIHRANDEHATACGISRKRKELLGWDVGRAQAAKAPESGV